MMSMLETRSSGEAGLGTRHRGAPAYRPISGPMFLNMRLNWLRTASNFTDAPTPKGGFERHSAEETKGKR